MSDPAKKRRALITGILSAILYGAWAFYANYHETTRWASTIGQAIGSFFGGYLVAAAVEYTFSVTRRPWRFPLAALGPYSITLLIYALIHAVIGTPDILKTIMPNIIIGTTYFLLYCVKLERNAALALALAQPSTAG